MISTAWVPCSLLSMIAVWSADRVPLDGPRLPRCTHAARVHESSAAAGSATCSRGTCWYAGRGRPWLHLAALLFIVDNRAQACRSYRRRVWWSCSTRANSRVLPTGPRGSKGQRNAAVLINPEKVMSSLNQNQLMRERGAALGSTRATNACRAVPKEEARVCTSRRIPSTYSSPLALQQQHDHPCTPVQLALCSTRRLVTFKSVRGRGETDKKERDFSRAQNRLPASASVHASRLQTAGSEAGLDRLPQLGA